MKKAVIATGGKQYLVTEGQTLAVELLKTTDKTVTFAPLLFIDDNKIIVGTPELNTPNVVVEIVEQDSQTDKVTSIRYKAKKRVHTVKGHRQHVTTVRVTKIA